MKRLIQIVFILAGTAVLFDQAVAAEVKIGVVNIPQIMEQAPQAQEVVSKLEEEFRPRERELLAAQKKIRELEDKMTRDAAVMSDSERDRLERDIRVRRRELQRSQQELQDDFNFQRNEMLERLQRDIFETIRAYAEESSYDLILAEGVLYRSDSVDVTEQVLSRLKAKAK